MENDVRIAVFGEGAEQEIVLHNRSLKRQVTLRLVTDSPTLGDAEIVTIDDINRLVPSHGDAAEIMAALVWLVGGIKNV